MHNFSRAALFIKDDVFAVDAFAHLEANIFNHGPGDYFANWAMVIPVMITCATFSLVFCHLSSKQGNSLYDAPFVGSRHSWLSRLVFFSHGAEVIKEGHTRYRDRPWKLTGNDVIVLPHKYLNEIRQLPLSVASAMQANVDNMQGKHTHLDVLNTTRLFVDVLRSKVNPQLGVLVPTLHAELVEALLKLLPNAVYHDWVSLEAFPILHATVGRISARVFVGKELKDDERWLAGADGYLTNIFKTAIAIRLVPSPFRTLASWFIPCAWQLGWSARRARRVITPYIQYRKTVLEQRAQEIERTGKTEFPDVLQFLIEQAQGRDAEDENLAGMILSLSLASNHTTTMALVEALYDLCVHYELQGELREEVRLALQSGDGWRKKSLLEMRKLDSFIKESQRLHPPSQMGYKRKLRQAVTLSDGVQLPKGAHLEFPIVAIQQDNTENAAAFDGLRYYNMRQSNPEEAHRHQFATTSESSLHFGHGSYSCPGRFMASSVIKMILATLLIDFEFKLAGGLGARRPEGIHAFEYNFPNPTAMIMLKRRQKVML